MTVCDLVAGSLPVSDKRRDELVDRVYRAFEQIERPGPVRCQVKDLGLKRTIAAMVRFPDARELRTVLDMERQIKKTAQVDERDFVGHISLAYLVPRPREAVKKEACGIKSVMRAYKHYAFGEFVFERFDLAAFADMNTYLPILTKSLVHGTVSRC
jgi:hypothetical protein